MRIEEGLAPLPSVWRRRMDIEVPQQTNPQRLETKQTCQNRAHCMITIDECGVKESRTER